MKQQEKQEYARFLVFLHPGAEVRLGWLMWKAWWRVKASGECRALLGGVSAGSEGRRVWGRSSATNPVTHPSSSQTSSASLLTLPIHPKKKHYTWEDESSGFTHTQWCENDTSAHMWQWLLESLHPWLLIIPSFHTLSTVYLLESLLQTMLPVHLSSFAGAQWGVWLLIDKTSGLSLTLYNPSFQET